MAARTLGPAGLAVAGAVRAALRAGDTALVVACSGGADSLALAVGARVVASRTGRELAAVVVDHGLQAGSGEVAEAALRQLRGLGIEDVRSERVEVTHATGAGPEAAARAARYAALRRVAAGRPILLGHTRDDQAETVLLALARGSGTRSLAGMAPRQGDLVRPLLELDRSITRSACVEMGLQPWSDPHNDDPAFARSRVRHRVLPVLEAELGPGVAAALARTASLARADADHLDALAAAADPGGPTLRCADVAGLPEALRTRVLRRWLLRCGAREVGLEHVRAVDALLSDWHGQSALALPGVSAVRQDGELRCVRTSVEAR